MEPSWRAAHHNAPASVVHRQIAHYNALKSGSNAKGDRTFPGLHVKEITLEERKAYILNVAEEVAQGKLTLGGAVKRLREDLLGVSQERFAGACKISKRALSQLEVDKGNPTLATLEAVFNKFGLKVSLAHLSPADLDAAHMLKSKAGFASTKNLTVQPDLPPME